VRYKAEELEKGQQDTAQGESGQCRQPYNLGSVIHVPLLSFCSKDFLAKIGPIGHGIESISGRRFLRYSARFDGCGVILEMIAEFAENFFFPASWQPKLAQVSLDQFAITRHAILQRCDESGL
jgi:hypothetical protein